jgi:hypothetical protein
MPVPNTEVRHCVLLGKKLLEEMVTRYPAVGHAVRCIERKRRSDRDLAGVLDRLERQLVDIATPHEFSA